MPEPVEYTILTGREHLPIIGADTTILTMPPQFYVETHDGLRGLAIRQFASALRGLMEEQAFNLNEVLHHGEFVITRDPTVIRARGSLHDCDHCRAGVAEALRAVQRYPDVDVCVGTLYWAEASGLQTVVERG